MNMFFFLFFLVTSNITSIDVQSGTVITPVGESVEIGKGTFIPSPGDEILAKKIEEKNLEIGKLRIDLSACEKKRDLEKEASIAREKELNDYHRARYRELKIENESMKNWWNQWGRTLIASVLIGGAAVTVTYFVIPR